jgi:hypothetical protein
MQNNFGEKRLKKSKRPFFQPPVWSPHHAKFGSTPTSTLAHQRHTIHSLAHSPTDPSTPPHPYTLRSSHSATRSHDQRTEATLIHSMLGLPRKSPNYRWLVLISSFSDSSQVVQSPMVASSKGTCVTSSRCFLWQWSEAASSEVRVSTTILSRFPYMQDTRAQENFAVFGLESTQRSRLKKLGDRPNLRPLLPHRTHTHTP